jgi:hypothetical protein
MHLAPAEAPTVELAKKARILRKIEAFRDNEVFKLFLLLDDKSFLICRPRRISWYFFDSSTLISCYGKTNDCGSVIIHERLLLGKFSLFNGKVTFIGNVISISPNICLSRQHSPYILRVSFAGLESSASTAAAFISSCDLDAAVMILCICVWYLFGS